ncbi:MAG: OB-fold nucleic acid binding domain-containing protein [Candidatus Parvarchaeota archaeon]|jgi:ssDNA-binding replication factor A large subunit|nr:OB-fold nucleic acid binding domain-containing protein [Candidatus Parvarchaeota archaeon]MCL5018116.1 OB-fold nucleic acid binding domain-containing protein [Candidatus Parvarchaeota archaeon]
MKINEIKDGMNDVSVSGEITEISESREVITKFGTSTVATAKLKDDTGEILLSLWGRQIDMVHVGDKIEITGGYTKSFKDQVQINIGKNGSLKKVEA